MNFGSGSARSSRRWSIAGGVRVMAALRGRSLVVRFGFSVDVVEGGWVTGFGFWASASGILIDCFSGCFKVAESYCPVCLGGLILLISGDEPAIDVSGMFVLRGGGGAGSRECGRYSVAVESLRL